MAVDYWFEYLPPAVEKRFLNCRVKSTDLIVIIATFQKYHHPDWDVEKCVETIIEEICLWNDVDLDPNNLDYEDLIRQVKEINV